MNEPISQKDASPVIFLDYWMILKKWKILIVSTVGGLTLLSIVVSLTMTPVYQAKGTLMIRGEGSSIVPSLMGQLGFGTLAGDGQSRSSQLMTVLESRTLAERAITHLRLQKILYPNLWDDEKQTWKVKNPRAIPSRDKMVEDFFKTVQIRENKRMFTIQISALWKEPQIAANLVNGYIRELDDYLEENTFTAAKHNRQFIEGQLERNKAELLESGKGLSEFYASHKISTTEPKLDVDVSVSDMDSPTPQSPTAAAEPTQMLNGTTTDMDIEQTERQLEGVNRQIEGARIVKGVPPQIYLQYLVLRRELLGQLNGLLTQQYEMAKIEEAKSDLAFQVVDWAWPPSKRIKPKRKKMVMMTFAASILLALALSFGIEQLKKDPFFTRKQSSDAGRGVI